MNGPEPTAEKLVNRFENILKDHHLRRKRPYALSMSLGVARFDPQNPCFLEVLLAEADALMYENKQKKKR
jgi:GGDEF domain-containing protein